MDFFDECIFEALKDGKPRDFSQILRIVDFSHNTLRLHLVSLVERDLIVKEKSHSKGLGRPKFMYSIPSKLNCQLSHLLSEDYAEISISGLIALKASANMRKADAVKNTRANAKPKTAPKS